MCPNRNEITYHSARKHNKQHFVSILVSEGCLHVRTEPVWKYNQHFISVLISKFCLYFQAEHVWKQAPFHFNINVQRLLIFPGRACPET